MAILVVALLFTALLPALHEESYAASGASGNWISYATSGFSGGSGSSKDPYRISNATQLAFIALQTNKGEKKYSQAFYKLTRDIDLSGHYWTPIGTSAKHFSGTLDGSGHTIKGLAVKGKIENAG
jgi:hypothetical protein